VTELAHELRAAGVDIPDDVITEEECAECILKILGKT
jgi:energy-coupling factor transport system ATP-binding protein